MLTHLRVENLKSVSDSGPLQLRPLTFLMGPNSSGKSTLLQAILLARQTVDSRDVANPLVTEGAYVKLGAYRDFIHRHDRSRRLRLEIGVQPDNRLTLEPGGAAAGVVDSLRMMAEFSYNQKTFAIFPTVVSYATSPTVLEVTKRRVTRERSTIEMQYEGKPLRVSVHVPGKFYDIARGAFPLLYNTRYAPSVVRREPLPVFLTREFEAALNKTFYVGPLRTGPLRTYVAAGETPQDVGFQGEATFAILWAARWNRRLQQSVFRPSSEWLRRFDMAARLDLERVGGTHFRLLFTDPTTGIQASFADVGFGASQLLPAIVQSLYAPRGSTIIMEQPEIHLHPAAQGTLGDLFIEGTRLGKQLIIETHSEHLVSRVLRRVAEGALSRDKVAIYYCSPSEAGTQVKEIELDEFGRFGEGLPPGFFEEAYKESLAHVQAMAARSASGVE